MFRNLKSDERVYSAQRFGVGRSDVQHATVRQVFDDVVDFAGPFHHHRRARYRLGVNEAWKGEIPALECSRDAEQMQSDLADSHVVVRLPLEDDAASFGQRLELMRQRERICADDVAMPVIHRVEDAVGVL